MMSWRDMDNDSRVWIYQSDRELSKEEGDFIVQQGEHFIESWTAHGAKMKASIALFHQTHLVIFADESAAQASGCSIDASVHFVQDLGKELNVDFFNRLKVAVSKENRIHLFHSSELTKKIKAEELTWEDTTFDNLVSTKSDFEKKWRIPLKNSWLAQAV
ncbi:MAG: ABC transporter ATPase [Bacteroidota bacterium]